MTSAEVLAAAGSQLYDSDGLNRAMSRLEGLQRPDGSWTDPNDPNPWDCSATAWCAWTLQGRYEKTHSSDRALDFLESQIRSDGGVSTNISSNQGNTYASAYAWRVFIRNERRAAAEKVYTFLLNMQNQDGGWGLTAHASSEPTLTMYVLDGFLGVQERSTLRLTEPALSWLEATRSADGTFGSWLESGASIEGTAFGLYILHKAKRFSSTADRLALEYIARRAATGDAFSIDGAQKIWVAVSMYLAAKDVHYTP
nr:terpene cyclase/mutase family protein [Bradyrhizobium sp. 6(2017)]